MLAPDAIYLASASFQEARSGAVLAQSRIFNICLQLVEVLTRKRQIDLTRWTVLIGRRHLVATFRAEARGDAVSAYLKSILNGCFFFLIWLSNQVAFSCVFPISDSKEYNASYHCDTP